MVGEGTDRNFNKPNGSMVSNKRRAKGTNNKPGHKGVRFEVSLGATFAAERTRGHGPRDWNPCGGGLPNKKHSHIHARIPIHRHAHTLTLKWNGSSDPNAGEYVWCVMDDEKYMNAVGRVDFEKTSGLACLGKTLVLFS